MESSSLQSSGLPPGPFAAPSQRRHRGAWSGGILASVLLHALVIFVWRAEMAPPAPGPSDPAPRFVRSLPIPTVGPPEPARAIRQPELPAPTLARATSRAVLGKVAVPSSALPNIPSVEVEPPPQAPVSGGGGGGANARAVPVSILPNWRPPTAAIGMEVIARVLVTASGEATGPVELMPPTPDHGFNRRIADRVRRLDYRPALRDGVPIADWAEISFVFCKTTVVATSPPGVNRRGRPCAPPGSGS